MAVQRDYIEAMPKAELHVHLEGTLAPEMLFEMAARNGVSLAYASVAGLERAYRFDNLQQFLDLYYQGTSVLSQEQDFYDLTWAYLESAAAQNILHTEVFFDPQAHTGRGVPLKAVIAGIARALDDGRRTLGLSSGLILSFLRHLDEASAFKVLDEALELGAPIIGVGLDSSEIGNPPEKFKRVFAHARARGLRAVAHAGEEGPAAYVWGALDALGAERIDHGNRALEDAALVARLVAARIPLTVCPLSNLKLRIVDKIENHPLRKMLDLGLMATVNSDDPAYFGGDLTANLVAVAEGLDLTAADMLTLAGNSFQAAFLPDAEKQRLAARLEEYHRLTAI